MTLKTPRPVLERPRVRIGLGLTAFGFLTFLLGADPGLIGYNRSPATGYLQILVFLSGLLIICLGGYIAGNKELRDYLINTARSFIFTTAHPPSVAAASMEAIRMIQDEPEHLQQLWENTRYFKKAMIDLGFDIGYSQTPITPVMAGESKEAMELSRQLFEEGLFAKPIVFPLVAKDKARVRINVTAQHTREDLDEAIAIFEKVGKRMKLI